MGEYKIPRWAFLASVSPLALAACASIEPIAVVCDDTAEPDCAPEQEVIVE